MSLVQNPELLIKVIIIITVLTTENDNSLSAKKKKTTNNVKYIPNFFSDTIGKGLIVTVNVTNGAYNNDFW